PAQLPRRQGEGGRVERGDHVAPPEPAQVPTLVLGPRIIGMPAGQGLEVAAAPQLVQDLERALTGDRAGRVAGARRDHDLLEGERFRAPAEVRLVGFEEGAHLVLGHRRWTALPLEDCDVALHHHLAPDVPREDVAVLGERQALLGQRPHQRGLAAHGTLPLGDLRVHVPLYLVVRHLDRVPLRRLHEEQRTDPVVQDLAPHAIELRRVLRRRLPEAGEAHDDLFIHLAEQDHAVADHGDDAVHELGRPRVLRLRRRRGGEQGREEERDRGAATVCSVHFESAKRERPAPRAGLRLVCRPRDGCSWAHCPSLADGWPSGCTGGWGGWNWLMSIGRVASTMATTRGYARSKVVPPYCSRMA